MSLVVRWQTLPLEHKLYGQIPPDLGVNSQAIDIAQLIFIMNQATKRRPTLCRNRIARFEQLSTSEAHESTTKSDGM
jgi:hypothetical protein